MSLKSGEYYIENHFTHSSVTRGDDDGIILARIYTDPTTQKFTVKSSDNGYTIQNENDSTYVAAESVTIGAKVISQKDTKYYWDISSVGDNHYSITKDTASDGQIAMQVVSVDPDVVINMGSHVGGTTQRWHFTKL